MPETTERLAGQETPVRAKEQIQVLKEQLPNRPIFAFLEKFDSFFKKRKRLLSDKEHVFDVGEDPNFYIITSGSVIILRDTATGEKKEIGRAYAGSFLGEGVLFGRMQKETSAIAAGERTEVVAITLEDLKFLEERSAKDVVELYRHVLETTNFRLLEAGKELANLYELTEKINELSQNREQGFINIVKYLKRALRTKYIIYVERHPVVQELYVYKFNSTFPSIYPINQLAKNELGEKAFGDGGGGLEILGAQEGDELFFLPLENDHVKKGYFIL